MIRATRLLAVLALAACAKDHAADAKPIIPPPVTFTSGSRLHAVSQEIDGVKMFVGWQDTQLGKPCAFLEGECLPGTTRIESEGLAAFDDEACTSRIISKSSETSFDPWFDFVAFRGDPFECGSVSVYVLGETVTPLRVFRHDASGACVEEPSFGGEYVRLNPALDSAGNNPFVRAHEENDSTGGRIVARWRVADDGAREIIGAWDTERNVAVDVSTGARRWYPRDRATVASESRCPGVATSYACEPGAVFIGGDGCQEPQVYSIGARLADGSCDATSGPTFEVLSSIPTAAFAEAKSVEVGGGRVRLSMFARDDDRPILPRGFFDTEARGSCSPSEVDGVQGVVRCAPVRDSRLSDAYSEEGCTKKAAVFTPGAGACDAPPDVPHLAALFDGHFEIGARIFQAWRSNASGGCDPVVFTNDVSAYLVTPVDGSRFPILTLRTE